MSSGTLPRVAGLQKMLDRCQRLIRVYSVLRGVAETLCVLIACILFGCLLDYLIALPGIVRMSGLAATVLLTTGVAWKRLIQPLTGDVPAEELGAVVDLRFPELHEAIATLISIDSPTATSSEAGSVLMRNQLEQYVRSQVGNILPSDVVQSRPTIKRWGLASLSVLAILVPLLLWPSGSQLLLQRFALPFANLAAPSNLYFEIPDGNRTVAVNTEVQFVAIPHWRAGVGGKLPQGVVVEMQVLGANSEDLPMEFADSESHFSASLADIRNSVRYRVRGGGATTEWFELTVAEPPRILTAVLRATPPTYSGRPMEMYDGIVGEIHVFQDSAIEIMLTFSKPVQNVEMDWQTWKPISATDETDIGFVDVKPTIPAILSADGASAQFQFSAAGSGQFEFQVEDSLGLTNLNETMRRLIVMADMPPKLIVTGVNDGLEVRPTDVLPLNCTATDDVGVGELEMHAQRNADVPQIESAVKFSRGASKVAHDFQVDLKSLDVHDGDILTIRVKAADERPMPGPQVVWQGPWTIRISDDAEAIGQRALREADQKLIESLRAVEEQLVQDAKKASELKDKLAQESNEEAQQGVRDLSEKEQTQGRKLQSLAEETATHPLMKKQAEKLTELAQQIRQDVPKKLDEAVAAGRESAAQSVHESVDDLNRIREELHRTTDEIEKAAQLEQELAELNRLALEARQLANDSQKLHQQRKDRQPEEGQSEEDLRKELDEIQRGLQQEQQALTADLGSLLQRRQELLQAAREAELDRAAKIADQTQRLAQQQQQLAEGVTEEASDETGGATEQGADGRRSESSVGEKVLDDLAKMTEAAHETADSVQADKNADDSARQQAKQAAERADEALRHALAGQFSRAAERMRDAANASGHAADQMQDDTQQDRRGQLQQQRDSFNRMSEVVQQLQDNNQAQIAAQRSTQRKVANAAEQLPAPLEELAERLNIPELGLQSQARPAQEAAQAAREGAQSGEAASEHLNETQLQKASEVAQEAANQLNLAAQLAQQAAQGHREPNAMIPAEVGESVSDALNSLKKAAETIGQEAAESAAAEPGESGQSDAEGQSGSEGEPDAEGQSNEGQPGDTEAQAGKPGEGESGPGKPSDSPQGQPSESQQPGQPGKGAGGNGQQSSAAQQLDKAAKSLQAAARGALPSQFSPGQLSSDQDNASGEPSAEGNVSEFDGQSPNATRRKGNGRAWGGLNDDLDADVSDAGKEVLDNEYSELIRRYRRDLARSGRKSESKSEVEK